MADEIDLGRYLSASEAMMVETARKPVEGAKHHTLYGYVHELGHAFESQALTDDEMAWLFELIDGYRGRFPIKQCFSNAQRLLAHYDTVSMLKEDKPPHELTYVEGYAVSFFPLHHGWLTLNGKVVDLTLRLQKEELFSRKSMVCRRRLRDRVLGEFHAPRQYYGVELTMQQIRDRTMRTGSWGTLLDEWESGWPLLRNLGTPSADEGPHGTEETDEGQEPDPGSTAQVGGQASTDEGSGSVLGEERGRAGSGEVARDSAPDAGPLEEPSEGAG
jgi:hypothetical protein